MTDNPLDKTAKPTKNGTPRDKKEREQHWIARGNRILWGEEPTSKGDYLTPRRDLHWVVSKDGHYSIERRAP